MALLDVKRTTKISLWILRLLLDWLTGGLLLKSELETQCLQSERLKMGSRTIPRSFNLYVADMPTFPKEKNVVTLFQWRTFRMGHRYTTLFPTFNQQKN